MADQVIFKLFGVGEIPAEYAARVVMSVNEAYDGLLLLATFLTIPPSQVLTASDRLKHHWSDRTGTVSMPVTAESLQLKGVVLQSPGFWEFLGNALPLEALRKYLLDRHERQKDRAYRNRLEAEKLSINNGHERLKLVSDAIDLFRKAGLEETEIKAYIRDFAQIPLLKLETLQDRGLVTYGEIPKNLSERQVEDVDA